MAEKERWQELVDQIAKERDPEKIAKLAEELLRELDKTRKANGGQQ
jgi:hypothetical protein